MMKQAQHIILIAAGWSLHRKRSPHEEGGGEEEEEEWV